MKKKLVNTIAIVFMLCACFCTGCTCDFGILNTMSAPQIVYFDDYDTITWKTVSNAVSYNVYCDNEVIGTVVDEYEEDYLLFELGKYINDLDEHNVYITASSDNPFVKDSDSSNQISHTNESVVEIADFNDYQYDIRNATNFTLSGTQLSYTPIEGIEEYYLFIHSNSEKEKIVNLEGQSVSLKSANLALDKKNEISYLRLAYKLDNVYYMVSNELYYNPVTHDGYTDNIIIFDGLIYDHYIESLQELNNVVYHNFIYRIEDYDLKFSDDMESFLRKGFSGNTLIDKVDNAIYYSFINMMETSEIIPNNNGGFASVLNGKYEFNIKVDYGSKECNINLAPTLVRSQDSCEGYYDTVDYTMRKESYGSTGGEFASDRQLLQEYVTTSEELYWAVENKVTPRFGSNTSRAYVIYNKAKEVINSVVSDDMTDYEKALSLFDWICVNTVYDFSVYPANVHVGNQPCYYLEGVFLTGYAVCDGYSKAYSLMCNMIGIECIRITGEAYTGDTSGGHAWNKIVLDIDPSKNNGDECYLIDITWTEIQTSESTEQLSRTYFMLSDDDVAETHFPHVYRTEFALYDCPERYDFYLNTNYSYKNKTYDLVIDSDNDFKSYFNYMLDSATDYMEVVIDYDYMVDMYESKMGLSYDPRVDYEVLKDSNGEAWGVMYYVKLMDVVKAKMKEMKYQETFDMQFMSYVRSDDVVPYGEDKHGIVIVMEQYILIDENTSSNNEMKKFVEYMDGNNLVGNTYYLYINSKILNSSSSIGDIASANYLFSQYLPNCENVDFELELIKGNHKYDVNAMGSLFKVTVVEKE